MLLRHYKTALALLIACLYLISAPLGQASEENRTGIDQPLELTLVTYNIRIGVLGIEEVLDTLSSLNPDIVFLQEVHGPVLIPQLIDQSVFLAEGLGLHAVFGKAQNWMTGEYGIAILSRYPFIDSEAILLPNLPGEEQEVLLRGQIETPLGPISLFNTHFIADTRNGHDVDDLRWQQAESSLREILKSSDPVIFGGDLNTFAFSGIKRLFEDHLVDLSKAASKGRQSTFPAFFPLVRIDYLYASSAFDPVKTRVIKSKASDHRPLMSKVRFRPERSEATQAKGPTSETLK